MMKKISLILLVIISLFSCGKKGDPVYNDENQNSKIFSVQRSVLS